MPRNDDDVWLSRNYGLTLQTLLRAATVDTHSGALRSPHLTMRLTHVMHMATATPSTLLQLSVHRLAQHSVAKSIGIITDIPMRTGS